MAFGGREEGVRAMRWGLTKPLSHGPSPISRPLNPWQPLGPLCAPCPPRAARHRWHFLDCLYLNFATPFNAMDLSYQFVSRFLLLSCASFVETNHRWLVVYSRGFLFFQLLPQPGARGSHTSWSRACLSATPFFPTHIISSPSRTKTQSPSAHFFPLPAAIRGGSVLQRIGGRMCSSAGGRAGCWCSGTVFPSEPLKAHTSRPLYCHSKTTTLPPVSTSSYLLLHSPTLLTAIFPLSFAP